MKTRLCTRCDERKPLDEFPAQIKNGKLYHPRECKLCRNDRQQANEWRKRNAAISKLLSWPAIS